MSYTATTYVSPALFAFPRGKQSMASVSGMIVLRGNIWPSNTLLYTTGGLGSTSFEVTAFSGVGLVTYSALLGVPLLNGQRVVIFNTSSNTNDGTYVVSSLTATTTTSGTFIAVPIGLNTLSGTAQTSQTAQGVGQIQFGQRAQINTTFTATAVTVTGGVATITYTTLVGPQLVAGEKILTAGMTNAGNNGNFTINAVKYSTATTGSFTITNSSAVASDSGTGTGYFQTGASGDASANEVPVEVNFYSPLGFIYKWDTNNYTMRIFQSNSSAAALAEIANGGTITFDSNITFSATFLRNNPN